MTRTRLLVAIVLAVAAILALRRLSPAGEAAGDGATFKNVQILKDVRTKSEMRAIMKQQAASLGVKCVHCHVPGKFDLDDKPEKVTARKMMKMVAQLNENYFADVDADEKPAITCWTCHRGAEEPEHAIPPSAMSAGDSLDTAAEPGAPGNPASKK